MNTPITDAEAGYEDGSGCWKYRPNGAYVPADLARQLERDRARLMEALRVITTAVAIYRTTGKPPYKQLADAHDAAAALLTELDALAPIELKDYK